MNVTLLKRIETWLRRLRHTAHFNMDYWADRNDCGTSYCIAGKALQLSGYKLDKDGDFIKPDGKLVRNPLAEAGRLLGIDPEDRTNLFYTQSWPSKFQLARRMGDVNECTIAADRIKYFIENKV